MPLALDQYRSEVLLRPRDRRGKAGDIRPLFAIPATAACSDSAGGPIGPLTGLGRPFSVWRLSRKVGMGREQVICFHPSDAVFQER